jgi:hypothetical protein
MSEMLRMLLKHPQFHVLAKDPDGSFYLHRLKDPDVFEILMQESKLDLNLRDSVSWSSSFYSCRIDTENILFFPEWMYSINGCYSKWLY